LVYIEYSEVGVVACLPIYASGVSYPGLGGSPQATDTLYREVLGLTQDKVPNTLQSIHLHCFNGDEATVKLWSDAYPRTYFGFSSMATDRGGGSPHLPDVAGSINHPAQGGGGGRSG
jgi:hypothetical protein